MFKFLIVSLGLVAWVTVGAATAQRRSNPRIPCTPSDIRQGQTLKLRMPIPHGGELGVRTPDNRFLFIAYQFDPQVNPIPPPVPSAEFVKMRLLEFVTQTAMGVELSERSPAERIFTTFGRYRFIVSQNLETEDDTHLNLICDVQYLSTSRK